jgi:hypothetical protein
MTLPILTFDLPEIILEIQNIEKITFRWLPVETKCFKQLVNLYLGMLLA